MVLYPTFALIILLALAERPLVMRMAVGPVLGIQSPPLALAMNWLLLLLLGLTVTGLALQQKWGAYALIALVPVSTILHSFPLVPLVTALAPHSYRPYAMVAVNIAVLLAVPALLRGSPTEKT
jgi:hypothetical protein